MRMLFVALLLAIVACGKAETDEVAQVVKQTVDAMREKERVVIQVRLDKSKMPSAEELDERRRLEEEIEVSRRPGGREWRRSGFLQHHRGSRLDRRRRAADRGHAAPGGPDGAGLGARDEPVTAIRCA